MKAKKMKTDRCENCKSEIGVSLDDAAYGEAPKMLCDYCKAIARENEAQTVSNCHPAIDRLCNGG